MDTSGHWIYGPIMTTCGDSPIWNKSTVAVISPFRLLNSLFGRFHHIMMSIEVFHSAESSGNPHLSTLSFELLPNWALPHMLEERQQSHRQAPVFPWCFTWSNWHHKTQKCDGTFLQIESSNRFNLLLLPNAEGAPNIKNPAGEKQPNVSISFSSLGYGMDSCHLFFDGA